MEIPNPISQNLNQLKLSTRSMPKIPEPIIEEILFFLPVKSILKFRCVSRSWQYLLDSPYFLKTYSSKATQKIILYTPDSFYPLDINIIKPKIYVLKICYPHSNTVILGSCNGMILSHHDNSIPGRPLLPFEHRWDFVLQNPYTRSFHKIPFVKHEWPGPLHVLCGAEKFIYGIWYDDLNDDYKVFRNCQFFGCSDGEAFYSQVNVYSLKRKLYKQIDPCPYYIKYESAENVLCGGALHWVVNTSGWDTSERICAFDVGTEKYRLVAQPLYSIREFKLYVHVLGGCLSVVCSYFPVVRFDVWVMKEYGNVASWSKQISIQGADIGMPIGYVKPLVYSECGKRVLIKIGCQALLWYDLENKYVEIVEMDEHQVPKRFQAFVHMETLAKLSGCCPGDEK